MLRTVASAILQLSWQSGVIILSRYILCAKYKGYKVGPRYWEGTGYCEDQQEERIL